MTSHVTSNMHLEDSGELDTRFRFHGDIPDRSPYAAVTVEDVTIFVQTPGQSQQLADLFADVADAFGTNPVRTYVLRRAREAVAEFRAWLETPAGELVWCENLEHPQEDTPHAPRDDCKFPHNSGRHADQYRYAEFAGRLATLVDELTDTPEAVRTEDAPAPVPPAPADIGPHSSEDAEAFRRGDAS